MHAKQILQLFVALLSISRADEANGQIGAPPAQAERFDDATLTARLSSVLVRGRDVFAANRKGLFRASLGDKHWKRLPIIDRMPLAGHFGRVPKDSQDVFYHSLGFGPVVADDVRGLYHSHDSGRTWKLVSEGYDFQHVYLHADGSLYAIIVRTLRDADKTWYRWCVLHAAKLEAPLAWTDITGNLPRGVELTAILDDRVHPELVQLRGESLRSYTIHANGANYRWQMTRKLAVPDRNASDDAFLAPVGSATRILYLYQATLANYFDHPFGERTELHAFTIQADSDSFTFAADEPKVVAVSIRFLRPETVRVIDVRDSLDCWAAHVVTSAGERIYSPPRGHISVPTISQVSSARDPKKKAEFRARQQLIDAEISSAHPYRRTIDLERFADFSRPGVYRLRLSYDSSWLAEEDEWAGSFCSDILTVTIRKSDR